MKKITLQLLIFSVMSFPVFAKKNTTVKTTKKSLSSKIKYIENKDILKTLKPRFLRVYTPKDNKKLMKLKADVMKLSGKAVPILIDVMKKTEFPDKNRWVATFLLGKIMGKKASGFISKFVSHPNWVLRMAALKTLLALKEKQFAKWYAKALRDDAFLVRKQALDNIRKLSLTSMAPSVWAMLYDKRNYYDQKKQVGKTNLIRSAIRTVGDLKFEKALKPLFSMIQKDKYVDVFNDVEYALFKITGKTAPKGNIKKKRYYWKRMSSSHINI